MNVAPRTIAELNNIPIKQVGNTTIYLKEVATVSDGFAVQTNVVRQDGQRGVLVTILKAGTASTLDVVSGIKQMLPRAASTLPPEMKITPLADQSVFVRSAISGVVREAIIAACLTGLMILLFIGSWRSTLIIAVSIPLSILTSILVLSFLHETINIMTLGGLALAVGILVDDATVDIENINRILEEGHETDIKQAILDGAQQIAVPALVSTLCICIVFMPMFFLERRGALSLRSAGRSGGLRDARVLLPLADAGADARDVSAQAERARQGESRNPLVLFQRGFERGFEQSAERAIERLLTRLVVRRKVFIPVFLAALPLRLSAGALARAGLLPRHATAASSSCTSAPRPARASRRPRSLPTWSRTPFARDPAGRNGQHPRQHRPAVTARINLHAFHFGRDRRRRRRCAGLARKNHQPTADYVRALRQDCRASFPGRTFYFLPADIVTQILNFGLPAPIDIQIDGSRHCRSITRLPRTS